MEAGRLSWEELIASPHGLIYAEKSYGHLDAVIATADGAVHLAPDEFVTALRQTLHRPVLKTSEPWPMLLSNQRLKASMNSWLNDTPTSLRRNKTNGVRIHPDDAERLGIRTGDRYVSRRRPLAGLHGRSQQRPATRCGDTCTRMGLTCLRPTQRSACRPPRGQSQRPGERHERRLSVGHTGVRHCGGPNHPTGTRRRDGRVLKSATTRYSRPTTQIARLTATTQRQPRQVLAGDVRCCGRRS